MDKKDFWETLESIFFNELTRNGWVVENEKTMRDIIDEEMFKYNQTSKKV